MFEAAGGSPDQAGRARRALVQRCRASIKGGMRSQWERT